MSENGMSVEEMQRRIAEVDMINEPQSNNLAFDEEPQDDDHYEEEHHQHQAGDDTYEHDEPIEEPKKQMKSPHSQGTLKEDRSEESYLDRQDLHFADIRDTKYSDSTAWGVKKEIYDEQKLNFGSYLEQDQRNRGSYRHTGISDSTKFGKSEIIDETTFNLGSYLSKSEEFKKKRMEEENRIKKERIDAMKTKYADSNELQFSYDELKGKQFPDGVDPTKKEQYLKDEDFEKVFGMGKDQFNSLAKFKRTTMKRKALLF